MSNQHPSKRFLCEYCKKSFASKDNVSVHLKKNRCVVLKFANQEGSPCAMGKHILYKKKEDDNVKNKLMSLEENFEKNISDLKKQIIELKENPSNIINNNLQIICVGKNDNFLKVLQLGDFDRALEYIKDCALSSLIGDCKLIERIYLGEHNCPMDPVKHRSHEGSQSIRYIDKSRNKIEYYNEKKEKVIDNKEMFGRKIANNLQNSYLFGKKVCQKLYHLYFWHILRSDR